MQPNGKLFLTGNTTNTSNGDVLLARYNSNGSLDNSFGTDGVLTLSVGYGKEGLNAIVINTSGMPYMAGYYNNGHDNDFLLMKLLPCFQESLTLTSFSDNYPNSNLPNPQIATSIIAFNSISSSTVTYQAVKSITLSPGFKVNQGAIFSTEMVGCSY